MSLSKWYYNKKTYTEGHKGKFLYADVQVSENPIYLPVTFIEV